MQILQQCRGGTKQHRMAGQHRGVTDILRDHRFAQAVAAHQDQVAAFLEKVQSQGAIEDVAFDFRRPGPIEVGQGLEALDPGEP
jgi:hypothetical protein